MKSGNPYQITSPLLSPEDVREIQVFIEQLQKTYGMHWSFILDLKDNIAQVLRCIYSDTRTTGLNPVMNIPLVPDLSWRVTAIDMDEPLFFHKLDLEDPRSFYLRKMSSMRHTLLFQIKADSNIGLLTMFTAGDDKAMLSKRDVSDVARKCQELVPSLGRVIMKMEQEVLNEAMLKIRKRETPIFISQLFNRLMDMPVLFLEKTSAENYQSIYEQGLPKQIRTDRHFFKISNPEGKKFLMCQWKDICYSEEVAPEQKVTAVFLGTPEYALLTFGELQLRGRSRQDFHHYLEVVESLLHKPVHQISTLTFLLHLQHWIRSGDQDISVIFQHIIDNLVPFLNADFGTLALLSREKNTMLFVSQAGEIVNPLKTLSMDRVADNPESIMAWVAENNKPYLASDVSKDPFYRAFNSDIRSEMCAPIQVRGETIGLFSVSSRKVGQFTKSSISKLCFFSDQIGIALFQAGILEKAFENEQARKLDQEIKFGFHRGTHAKNLTYNFGNLVGSGEGAMGRVFEAIQKINGSGRDDLNVLITGETGCGKEMVSFALHNSSRRGKRPMVVANFASFGGDPNLIQSELFGHEKGSFSGATERRIGCIEQANGSTLLIDEVGDIVSSVQIKLLRVLQQSSIKTFQRLGGQETIKSDVRILAATHKDLWKEIQDGSFREDLFYRLQTLVIRIPPLRERIEDIPMLVSHFSAKYQRMVPELEIVWTENAVKALQAYSWPGNVRQLEAVINRALVLYTENGYVNQAAINASLEAEKRPLPLEASLFKRVADSGDNAFWEMVREPYRNHEITRNQLVSLVRDSLAETKGSYKQAARIMGVLDKDYNRFLDFLKNSGAKPDFREFRKDV